MLSLRASPILGSLSPSTSNICSSLGACCPMYGWASREVQVVSRCGTGGKMRLHYITAWIEKSKVERVVFKIWWEKKLHIKNVCSSVFHIEELKIQDKCHTVLDNLSQLKETSYDIMNPWKQFNIINETYSFQAGLVKLMCVVRPLI